MTALVDRFGRLLSIAALLVGATACASARPRWVEHVPNGHTHEYFVGLGADRDRAAAREAAVASAMARVVEGGDVRLTVDRRDTLEREEVIDTRGRARVERRHRGTRVVTAQGAPVASSGLQLVAEHSEQRSDRFDVWVLMRRPRPEGGDRPPGPGALALRSAVLPGWGQFARGQPRRGAAILGAVGIGVPAALVLHASRSDAALRATRARTPEARAYWRDRANTLGTVRTGALALAGAAHLFGIADAAVRHEPDYLASIAPSPDGWTVAVSVPLRRLGGS